MPTGSDSTERAPKSQPTASDPENTTGRRGAGRVRKRPLRRTIAFACITAFGTATFLLLIGEVAFRVQQYAVGPRVREWFGMANEIVVGWPAFDQDLVYRNRPDWKDHNADGMRDHPTPSKNRFRLMMLGDSIGYQGDSIDDTYPAYLETTLNADPSTVPCDVLNAGTKGYTNYQELQYLKKYGLQLLPDSVGLGFCVNDLHQYLHGFDVVDGEIAANTYQFSADAARVLAPPILHPSLFLSWLWTKSQAATIHFGWQEGFIFDYRLDVCTAWQDEPWTAMEAQIDEMEELCRAQGATFFVVAFPYSYQYREDYLERDREYVLKPQARLRAICEDLKAPFLDLYPVLNADDFLKDGIHLTAGGRRRTGAAIAEFLTENPLVPTSGR